LNILISSASYIFTDHVPGGEYQIAYGIISRLAKRGHQVYVLAPKIELEETLKNVNTYEIGGFNFSNTDNYFDYQWNWLLFSYYSYLKAKQLVIRKKIDIIHHIRPAFSGKFSLCWKIKIPFIYGPLSLPRYLDINTLNEFDKWSNKNVIDKIKNKLIDRFNMYIGNKLWYYTLTKCTALPVSIPKTKLYLPKQVHKKCHQIPLGVDTNLFKPIITNKKTRRVKILFVGNLIKLKGVNYLIKAIYLLINYYDQNRIKLDIIGKGRDEDFYIKLVNKYSLNDIIEFKGEIPYNKIINHFQSCDIFCLPSLQEAWGLTLLQAMACGKPVISTNSGGPPHFVKNKISGFLVPPQNSEALAKTLIKLINDESKRTEMGKYNRQLCLKYYDWDKIVDQIEDMYSSILHQ